MNSIETPVKASIETKVILDESIQSRRLRTQLLKRVRNWIGKRGIFDWALTLDQELLLEILIETEPGNGRYTCEARLFSGKKLRRVGLHSARDLFLAFSASVDQALVALNRPPLTGPMAAAAPA